MSYLDRRRTRRQRYADKEKITKVKPKKKNDRKKLRDNLIIIVCIIWLIQFAVGLAVSLYGAWELHRIIS